MFQVPSINSIFVCSTLTVSPIEEKVAMRETSRFLLVMFHIVPPPVKIYSHRVSEGSRYNKYVLMYVRRDIVLCVCTI